jgi:hypothetical protein
VKELQTSALLEELWIFKRPSKNQPGFFGNKAHLFSCTYLKYDGRLAPFWTI